MQALALIRQDRRHPPNRPRRLPGQFDTPVVLEEARRLGSGYECRVRLPDGSLDEVVFSADEAAAVAARRAGPHTLRLVDPHDLSLLVESARIRLAYAHDRQFAVSFSGIRTLPHQVEAVYQRMLPQPCLRFLLADDPGAGRTIMAGLLIKELKLREAIDRVLILCPAPLTIQWQDEMQRWFGETFDIIFAAVDQQQLQIARTGAVRHLATALVLTPDANVERQLGALCREPDTEQRLLKERRAEEIVIEHLVVEDFPRDRIERVGSQKLGFDIRAHRIADPTTGTIEVRRVEVKGYSRGNDIQLTVNEWYKAQQLAQSYWLYVVWDPLGDAPELVRVHDPAQKLNHAKRKSSLPESFAFRRPRFTSMALAVN